MAAYFYCDDFENDEFKSDRAGSGPDPARPEVRQKVFWGTRTQSVSILEEQFWNKNAWNIG